MSNPPASSVPIEELLRHSDWVRGLARRLISEDAAAADVVQDTWVAALERPPAQAHNLRGWLGRVVRNQVLQRRRASERRRAREAHVARPEAQDPVQSADGLEALEQRAVLQRELVGHVLALDEPFRAVLLLLFFEGLTPPAVATRLQVPLKTVHSRRQRALEKLRRRLDAEHEGRTAWCALFAPFAAAGSAAPGGTAGTLFPSIANGVAPWIMQVNAKWIGVALVALGSGWAVWRLADRGPAAVPGADVAAEAPQAMRLAEPSDTPTRGDAGVAEREAIAEPRDALASAATDASAASAMRGRVVDVRGGAVPDVPVRFEADGASDATRTDAAGRFELLFASAPRNLLQWNSEGAGITVEDERWTTVRQARPLDDEANEELLVVVAPVTVLEGSVEDADGAPLEGANVQHLSPGEAFYGFPFSLERTSFMPARTTTDGAGRFRFERFPEAPGLRLSVHASGHESASIALDTAERPVVVRLERSDDEAEAFLEGIVLDVHGSAAKGAEVRLADAQATTDEWGQFRLRVPHVEPGTPLCAARKGELAALIPNFGAVLAAQGGRPEPVELRLGGPPLAIEGRVVDERGEPLGGWDVSLVDPTEISQLRIPLETAEELVAGKAIADKSDKLGRFQLRGLAPRRYELQAIHRTSLARATVEADAGRTDVELRVARASRGDVIGRVVDRHGAPLAGVEVGLALDTVRTAFGSSWIRGAAMRTDGDGAFRLHDVPTRDVYLSLQGASIVSQAWRFPDEGPEPSTGRVIEVARRCLFRIELADPASGVDRVRFLDAAGGAVGVQRIEASMMSGFGAVALVEGRSEVLSVSEDAVQAVLLSGGEERGRRTVQLSGDDVVLLVL